MLALNLLAVYAKPASAQAQTQTGFEYVDEQVASMQLGSRSAATANYLTACDLTSAGAGSRSGASALCSVRVYAGAAGDFSAYRNTYSLQCNEGALCSVQGWSDERPRH